MKKAAVLLLLGAFLFSMVGCGGEEKPDTSEAIASSVSDSSETIETEETKEPELSLEERTPLWEGYSKYHEYIVTPNGHLDVYLDYPIYARDMGSYLPQINGFAVKVAYAPQEMSEETGRYEYITPSSFEEAHDLYLQDIVKEINYDRKSDFNNSSEFVEETSEKTTVVIRGLELKTNEEYESAECEAMRYSGRYKCSYRWKDRAADFDEPYVFYIVKLPYVEDCYLGVIGIDDFDVENNKVQMHEERLENFEDYLLRMVQSCRVLPESIKKYNRHLEERNKTQ